MEAWVWVLIGLAGAILILGIVVAARRRRAPEDPLTAARRAMGQMSRGSGRTRKRVKADGQGGAYEAEGASCGSDGLG